MFLLLTLNIFQTFFWCSYCYFKQVHVSYKTLESVAMNETSRNKLKRSYQTLYKKWSFSLRISSGKCDHIHRKLRLWSNLLKKSLLEIIFVCSENYLKLLHLKNVRYDGNKVDWKNYKITLRKKKITINKKYLKPC